MSIPPCNNSRGYNASGGQRSMQGPPNASQRSAYFSMDRSQGGCPGTSQNMSMNMTPSMNPYAQYDSMQPFQSTPVSQGYPMQHETFGTQINRSYNTPANVNFPVMPQQQQNAPPRCRAGQQNFHRVTAAPPPPPPQFTTPLPDPNMTPASYGGEEPQPTEGGDKEKKKREETLMEWFDRTVEKELKKRKQQSFDDKTFVPLEQTEGPERDLGIAKNILGQLGEASASEVEIVTQMRMEPDTDLTIAVDKLAKAEAMCHFAGAVKAAEKAAESAPPGLAEEAAVASARMFHTEMKTDKVSSTLSGVRPLEVVGYVGVTNPKFPVKPKKKECQKRC